MQERTKSMKKTLVAVLATAAVAGLLVTAASPAKAYDGVRVEVTGGRVIVDSAGVPSRPAYGGPVYAADVSEPEPYGEPPYVAEPPPPRYYRPVYPTEQALPPPPPRYSQRYYDQPYATEPAPLHYGGYGGPVYANEPAPPSSSCYWHRQRYWDGYSWTVRPVRVCE